MMRQFDNIKINNYAKYQFLNMSHKNQIQNINQEDQKNVTLYSVLIIKSIEQQKLCPDLLNYQNDIIQYLSQQLKQQQQKLKQYLNQNTQTKLGQKNFKFSIYKYQIDRISYLLKSYHRIRLAKIQAYAFAIIKSKELIKLLSKPELQFVKSYSKLRYQQYNQLVLKDLHKDFRGLDGIENIFGKDKNEGEKKQGNPSKQINVTLAEPNKNGYRFFKVHKNPEQLRYNLDIVVTNIKSQQRTLIQQSDILFIPYKTVQRLHKSNCGEFI